MPESGNLPLQLAIEELENRVESLTRRLSTMENAFDAIRGLGRDFWRAEVAPLVMGLGVTAWNYNVKEENSLFPEIFQCETNAKGFSKRWIGRRGILGATIAINRTHPLVFSVRTVDFVAPALKESFAVELDGVRTEWTKRGENLWTALAEERPGQAKLQFQLSVNTEVIPPEKDVSYSISEISIGPLPMKEG